MKKKKYKSLDKVISDINKGIIVYYVNKSYSAKKISSKKEDIYYIYKENRKLFNIKTCLISQFYSLI